jgi:hypothetical protein
MADRFLNGGVPNDNSVRGYYCNIIVLLTYVVSELGYGLDERRLGVRFPTGLTEFCIFHNVKTGSGNQQASYPMGTGDGMYSG